MNEVRLTDIEISVIKNMFHKYFSNSDKLYLFGSRADLNKRGGDIDLYVETSLSVEKSFDAKLSFLVDVKIAIGDQKIDLVLNNLQEEFNLPIYDIAKQEGVRLV